MAGRKSKKPARTGNPKTRRDVGRDAGEEDVRRQLAPGEGEPARVIAHHGVAVLVQFAAGQQEQVWLQPDQRAVVGDRVRVASGRLDVDPAYGVLRRRDPRGRERTIATNLDLLGIVIAPEPREPPGYIDRGFVIARAAGIEPMLVMNKSDLDPEEVLSTRLREIYGPSATVLTTSADRGEGLDALRAELARADSEQETEAETNRASGRLGALVGPSGVGKSSLLNALVPDLELRVGELNRGSGKGRHTTTTATLHAIEGGGFLVDTAGFKDFIAVDVEPLEAARHFPGFEAGLEDGCRFRDCLHRTEPGCGVLARVESGEIDERRHQAYCALLDELASPDGRS